MSFSKFLFNPTMKFFSNIYDNKKLLLIFIFFVSVVVSLAFLIFFGKVGPLEHGVPGPDYTMCYKPWAVTILQGGGIPADINLKFCSPPVYSIILAIIFGLSQFLGISRLGLIIIFNIIMTAGAVCFLFLFVKSIFNKKIALISAFLWMTYPFNLWLIKNPNTEVPFILSLYFALLIYVLAVKKQSSKLFLTSGALFGFMSLIRPISIFLPFLLVILIFFLAKKTSFKKKILFSFFLLMVYAIIIFCWMIYVYLNIGEIVFLSKGGPQAVYSGLILMVDVPEARGEVILPNDVIDLIDRSRDRNMESFGNIGRFLFRELINHPVSFLKLILIKMARAWYATSSVWWEKKILLLQLLYLIPAIAGLIAWLKKLREKKIYLIFLLTIISYFWILTIIAHSILRYMIPIMGIVMIFPAVILCYLINILIKKLKIKY